MEFSDKTNPLALIAELKIRQAMDEGQFDHLPGRGQPQNLEDLSALPPDLRMAYIVLKNSGHLEAPAEENLATNLNHLLRQSSGECRDCAKLEKLKYLLDHSRRSKGQNPKTEPDESGPDGADRTEEIDPGYLAEILRRL